MHRIFLTAIAVCFATGAMAAGVPHSITRRNRHDQIYTVRFMAGGTILANSTARGGVGGPNFYTDTGRWWMQGSDVCWQYSSWQFGKTFCKW